MLFVDIDIGRVKFSKARQSRFQYPSANMQDVHRDFTVEPSSDYVHSHKDYSVHTVHLDRAPVAIFVVQDGGET